MKIEYFGHSCFKLTASGGTSVVCDPFSSEIGYEMPKVSADVVTVSHGHYDHNAVKNVGGSPIICENGRKITLNGIEISAINSFHDDCRGEKRGKNLIFKFLIDGITVCHLGDLGEPCSLKLIEAISHVNILLIPVGGNYTIDAQTAKEYVDLIKPTIVIPMHYRTNDCNIDIEKVDGFLKLFDEECVEKTQGNVLKLSTSDLSGKTKIVVMRKL